MGHQPMISRNIKLIIFGTKSFRNISFRYWLFNLRLMVMTSPFSCIQTIISCFLEGPIPSTISSLTSLTNLYESS
ncbi:unnamed protein product [Linum tenue]|uniref:Uncharacterized protein n=1 Tax=Linum tenue TaxID=586396 RepID=A0AAV0GQU2_9ROSI|nr:unnamed protein product [Linum tenue]